MTPLVSVIIPNYNHARFLIQRIESVLNQEYKNIEIIILDDSSTDNSIDVINKYQHNNLITHLIVNAKNGGSPFSQWLKGINLSSGKYIWIAESDDFSDISFLSTTVPLMEENENASFCFVGSTCVDSKGKKLQNDNDKWWKTRNYCKNGYKVFSGTEYNIHNMYWRCYIYNASGAIFRRSTVNKLDNNNRCFGMKSSGDWLFWIQMASLGEVIEVYKKLNYFRCHNSTSVIAKENGWSIKEDIEIIKWLEMKYPQIPRYTKKIRHGIFYRKIKNLRKELSYKKQLFEYLYEMLNGNKLSYRLLCLNKMLSPFLFFIKTSARDRL